MFLKTRKGACVRLREGRSAGESSGACACFGCVALLVTFIRAVLNTSEPL